jgi:hypothetical protein
VQDLFVQVTVVIHLKIRRRVHELINKVVFASKFLSFSGAKKTGRDTRPSDWLDDRGIIALRNEPRMRAR